MKGKLLILFCMIFAFETYATPYAIRRVNPAAYAAGANSGDANANNRYDNYPDDVKQYTNRLEQCYKLRNNNNPENNSLNKTQQDQLQCSSLQQDSQSLHYIYYQNPKVIDHINKYEKTYPFFGY